MTPDREISPQEPLEIHAKVRWLSCSNTECVPGSSKLSIQLPISNENPTQLMEITPRFLLELEKTCRSSPKQSLFRGK